MSYLIMIEGLVISLTELLAKGCYLFSGVQNNTNMLQETDQNYRVSNTVRRIPAAID